MTTSVRAAVSPLLLAWARERSGLEVDELATRFPKLTEWERGSGDRFGNGITNGPYTMTSQLKRSPGSPTYRLNL